MKGKYNLLPDDIYHFSLSSKSKHHNFQKKFSLRGERIATVQIMPMVERERETKSQCLCNKEVEMMMIKFSKKWKGVKKKEEKVT